jgi:hypothetical protein
LSNVEGPDHTRKLPDDFEVQVRRLALAASLDPGIGRRIPDLRALLLDVRRQLDSVPMVVQITGPGGSGPFKIPVGGGLLDLIITRDIGDATDLPVLPRLLYSVSQGNPEVLQWFVQKRAGLVPASMG